VTASSPVVEPGRNQYRCVFQDFDRLNHRGDW
jgi:hypothetical protein